MQPYYRALRCRALLPMGSCCSEPCKPPLTCGLFRTNAPRRPRRPRWLANNPLAGSRKCCADGRLIRSATMTRYFRVEDLRFAAACISREAQVFGGWPRLIWPASFATSRFDQACVPRGYAAVGRRRDLHGRRHADQALLKAVPDRAALLMSSVYSPKMPPIEKVRDKIDPHFRQAGATL
jgi:hypothetical protein